MKATESNGQNSSINIADQKPIQITTRQAIVNLVSRVIFTELDGMCEAQGKYISENEYVCELVRNKVRGIFNDPSITGHQVGDKIIFAKKVMQTHTEGGNLHLGGIKPEYRDAGEMVVDNEIELKIFTH